MFGQIFSVLYAWGMVKLSNCVVRLQLMPKGETLNKIADR